jgi:hypothetical protein
MARAQAATDPITDSPTRAERSAQTLVFGVVPIVIVSVEEFAGFHVLDDWYGLAFSVLAPLLCALVAAVAAQGLGRGWAEVAWWGVTGAIALYGWWIAIAAFLGLFLR